MGHILDDSINGVRKLACIVKRLQVSIIPTILAAIQRVLNVLADCSINIATGGFIIPERSIICIYIFVVECKFSGTKSTTVTNILIDAVNAQQSTMLSEGNVGCVNCYSTVVKFLTKCEPKAQRIRSGKNNLHSHGCIDI